MDGYGVHAFRLVNAQGQQVFAKFHWKSHQGVKGMTLEQANAADVNYATADLYDAIKAGHFPSWDLTIQMMTPEQTKALTYDAFDDSKIWENVPEITVGTMTLNKVPDNFFEYTEESAFAPSDLIPGVEASPTACCRAVSSLMPIRSVTASAPITTSCPSTARWPPCRMTIRTV
jgi:catalase